MFLVQTAQSMKFALKITLNIINFGNKQTWKKTQQLKNSSLDKNVIYLNLNEDSARNKVRIRKANKISDRLDEYFDSMCRCFWSFTRCEARAHWKLTAN